MRNKVSLIGRVGSDLELKKFQGDTQVVEFSLATTEKFKDKEGKTVEKTEWHNIRMWNKLAGIASKYLNKGDIVSIDGKITTDSWEKDGHKYYKTVIVSDDMCLLPNPKKEAGSDMDIPDTKLPEQPDLPF